VGGETCHGPAKRLVPEDESSSITEVERRSVQAALFRGSAFIIVHEALGPAQRFGSWASSRRRCFDC